jgi:hypothetical protein
MRKTLAVFALAALWCATILPWSSFIDPDAFYHATISRMLWERGPLLVFPWLDLTSLGTSFADHHFLFHIIEAPFVAALGPLQGARVLAAVLAAAFITTTYLALRWMKIRYAEVWTMLLALSGPLLLRLLLAKASPLALIWFVLGLAAAWMRRPWIVCIVAGLFALSHGGWLYLLGSIVFLAVGDAIFRRIVEEQTLGQIARSSLWREIVAAFVGAGIGTLLHPNFPENLSFLWVQVFKIGIGTPFQHVMLGSEWLPVEPVWMLASLAPWLLVLGGGIFGAFMARREPLDRTSARAVIAFALPTAALLAMTFKSRRSVEYLIPLFVLWVPWLWNMVDPRRLILLFREAFSPVFRGIVVVLLFATMVVLLWKQVSSVYVGLHRNTYPDTVYREVFAVVSERAKLGDRVFHSDWDEFPVLWSLDDRLKYIAGLDPTFLYEASSTLSDAYRDVTWGRTSSTQDEIWNLVYEMTRSRFIFIDKRDHLPLFESVKRDSRYELLRETDNAATFEIHPL